MDLGTLLGLIIMLLQKLKDLIDFVKGFWPF